MPAATRKRAELQAKTASLIEDFAFWQSLTEVDSMRLHKSQITRLIGDSAYLLALAKDPATLTVEDKTRLATPNTSPLGQLTARIIQEVQTAGGKPLNEMRLLADAQAIEETILATHCLWAFFREKFAQRFDTRLRPFLDYADELAWTCYEPARAAVPGNTSEPSLLYLNGALSPFMLERGQRWRPEKVPPSFLGEAEFSAIVSDLPLPVIGVPWVQVQHLPDVLFVAHETGHAVEDDFDLTDDLRQLLTTALQAAGGGSRTDQWLGWLGEVFADLFALANVGPGYVSALADFLCARAREPAGAVYPSVSLRLALCRAAIATMDPDTVDPAASRPFGDEAKRQLDDWQTAVPEAWNDWLTEPHQADLDTVARTLLHTPLTRLGGQTLIELGAFDAARWKDVQTAAEAANGGYAPQGRDARLVFAAVRRSYDLKPDTFATTALPVYRRALDQIIPGGTRTAPQPLAAETAGPLVQSLYDRLTDLKRKAE